MKYKKGTFVVIPNKQYLKGKPSEMQSIYFWLCEHADDNGGCFPTKDKLGEEAGCSHNTTDKYLNQLQDEGFIKITNRRKKGTKEFMSNHYQILILSHIPNMVEPSPNSGITPPPKIGLETISNINSNHLNTKEPSKDGLSPLKVKEEPYTFEVALDKLGNSKWVVDKIIYNFFVKKKFRFDNKKQFDSARSRNLRPAKQLEGYSAQQINKTMEYCQNNYKDFNWGLETIVKTIPSQVNVK